MIRTKPTPEQLANYHADQERYGKKNSKSSRLSAGYGARRRMLPHLLLREEDGYTLQLPLYVLPLNKNGSMYSSGTMTPIDEQRDMLWKCATTQLRALDRTCIARLEFTRFSPGKGVDVHDGKQPAFKYLCDALCAWIVEGPNVYDEQGQPNPRVMARIGHYDGKLLTEKPGGITWDYQQEKCVAHGVRIRIRLGVSLSPTLEP